jgi:uncharacterized protein (TIGR02217 family)
MDDSNFSPPSSGEVITADFDHIQPIKFTRKISKPVNGTVRIYIDGTEDLSNWTVDITTGLVTFSGAPSSGEVITADFDFDVPMRFDTDWLPHRLDTYLARSADVPIVELML